VTVVQVSYYVFMTITVACYLLKINAIHSAKRSLGTSLEIA